MRSHSLICMTGRAWELRRRKACRRAQAPGFTGTVRSLPRRVTIAAAAITLATGCSSAHPVNTGPFGDAGNGGLDCVPISQPGGFVTEGFNEVSDNWSGTVAVISKISLVRPRGLRLEHAYAVRLGDSPSCCSCSRYPPANPPIRASTSGTTSAPSNTTCAPDSASNYSPARPTVSSRRSPRFLPPNRIADYPQ